MVGVNNSVLQFFSTSAAYEVTKQHHNKWYAYGNGHPVKCLERRLPPFQLIGLTETAVNIDLVRVETGTSANIFNIPANPTDIPGFTSIEVETGVWNTYYDGVGQYTPATPKGEYYLEVEMTGATFYVSERFCITDDVSDMIKVTWWHEENFTVEGGVIVYDAGFKNSMYINSDLGRPLYPIDRQIVERGGFKYKVHQTRRKVFAFLFVATEGIADFFTTIGLHDHVEITYAGDLYEVSDFLPSVRWLEIGDVCQIDVLAETGAVTQTTGSGAVGAEYSLAYGDDYTS